MSVLTACGLDDGPADSPPVPIPSNVPRDVRYVSADEVVAALVTAGLDCKVQYRGELPRNGGSNARCTFEDDGRTIENEISVYNTEVIGADDIGDAIFSRRDPPFPQTLVAGGNWFVRVVVGDTTRYARKVAEATRGRVLPPLRKLPEIPVKPQYTDLEALAAAVDRAVGCTGRKKVDDGIACRSRAWKTDDPCDAHRDDYDIRLVHYRTAADREYGLLMKLAEEDIPYRIATAGNWIVQFRYTETRDEAARALGAAAVNGVESGAPVAVKPPCDPDRLP
ncbi:hypothetical protein B7R87_13635 [Streptomyces tsukubensis]|uniref:Uncharacterized protein n=1 Tax=Streptomyces tsukubensis (strain DSM 42081 / NBRC 108919 / NRRL 18488 / 9993) TaxID=1114943 RepID=A0A7G3UGJ3_STRT9|nr:hypothetical protein B7R87_13635 [Streptomyces tsukubensis]QKM69128.1 hypothetical protein STSU_020135 [Streptomyces tsukubensis NRRL18488]